MAVSGSYSTAGLDATVPPGYRRIHEGHAVVMMPLAEHGAPAEDGPDDDPSTSAIFYNPAQVVNRDMSVCVLETFSHLRASEPRRKGGVGTDGITVLEALAATGLRALRYWHEVEGIRHIIANDMDADAVQCIRHNCTLNATPLISTAAFNALRWRGAADQASRRVVSETHAELVHAAPRGIVPSCSDAVVLMQHLALDEERYGNRTLMWRDDAGGALEELLQSQHVDVVDLDPYGTASPFLDGCVSCAKEGALLLITCTDSAILCGNYAETCHAKYNSVSSRIGACHELAARIVLAAIERAANKHGKFITPLVSLHIDFYVRVFVRVFTQPAEVKLSVAKLANLFHCAQCPAYRIRPIAIIRPAKSARESSLKGSKPKMSRTEVCVSETAQGDEPVCYPAPPPRSTPLHTTATPLDDVPRLCDICGGRMLLAGPFYAAPAHDVGFVDAVIATLERKGRAKLKAYDRVRGLLEAARGELPDVPLFFHLPDLASLLKMHVPPTPLLVGALSRRGYRCSAVHCDAAGLKTTAPPHVVIGVMRAYREEVWRPALLAEHSDVVVADVPSSVRPPVLSGCDFAYDKAFDYSKKSTGTAKFVPNPAFWGPRARHVGMASAEQGPLSAPSTTT